MTRARFTHNDAMTLWRARDIYRPGCVQRAPLLFFVAEFWLLRSGTGISDSSSSHFSVGPPVVSALGAPVATVGPPGLWCIDDVPDRRADLAARTQEVQLMLLGPILLTWIFVGTVSTVQAQARSVSLRAPVRRSPGHTRWPSSTHSQRANSTANHAAAAPAGRAQFPPSQRAAKCAVDTPATKARSRYDPRRACAKRAQRLKEDIATKSQELAQVEAQQRADARAKRDRRRQRRHPG